MTKNQQLGRLQTLHDLVQRLRTEIECADIPVDVRDEQQQLNAVIEQIHRLDTWLLINDIKDYCIQEFIKTNTFPLTFELRERLAAALD
jgi:hypothetical protein